MRIFVCPACGERVFFENLTCACGDDLAYDPDGRAMVATAIFCANRDRIGCNWVAEQGGLCRSCAMTQTHPDLCVEDNSRLWRKAEAAKRWVLENLAGFGWFTQADQGMRPVFEMLSERVRAGNVQTIMGHDDGLITINLAEARPEEIVRRREAMGESYRTMIGHLRHEIAHFLHLRLSADEGFVSGFRDLFGDERADYGAALERHYAQPDDGSWRGGHITHYASAHPHEDWAETAAHVLHLVDMRDSALAVGLVTPTECGELDTALALGIALNHVNRSMGLDDIYPFVVSDRVRSKLQFAHRSLRLRSALSGP